MRYRKGQIMDTRRTCATANQMEIPKRLRQFEFAWPEPARIKSPEPGWSGCGNFSLVPTLVFVGLLASVGLGTPAVFAAQETCASCGQEVSLSGDCAHRKDDASITIQGAANNAPAFREDVNGKNFAVTIAHLPAGKCTIIVGGVETLVQVPGERLFEVTSGGAALATNSDIVAAAGGLP